MKFLILFALVLQACGTDVGNPGYLPANGQPNGISTTFMSEAMCNKLHVCYPSLSYSSCYTGIHSATGLTAAMGLNATTYPTLTSAETALANGTIHANSANLNQCIASINAMSCSDTNVISAYNTSTPTNFNNTYHVLSVDTICAQMTTP